MLTKKKKQYALMVELTGKMVREWCPVQEETKVQ